MKPNIMPRPISVNAVGKPIMITITMSASMVSPSPASLTFGSPRSNALMRGLVDLVGPLDCALAGLVIHQRAAGKLLLDHVDLLGILQAVRPCAGLQTDCTAYNFGHTLDQHQHAGDRNNGLERINHRPAGGHGMLIDAP